MVVFDATTLLYLFDPNAKPPLDTNSGKPVDNVNKRIQFLVEELTKSKVKIIIPTPALSELLVHAGEAGPKYLNILNVKAAFKISDFDQRAAVEVAATISEAINSGDKKSGLNSTWAKIKFDQQIVAIAKVEGASTVYSDDGDIATLGKKSGLNVIGVQDLPVPPESLQQDIFKTD